jgi:exopolysaccharide biosynthesis protein
MVTVDGRYHTSSGMTLGELQLFLKALGCQSAINLDGGGSTTMYIRSMEGVVANGVVNEPRNKPPPGVPGFHDFLTLRNVSNAVIVL